MAAFHTETFDFFSLLFFMKDLFFGPQENFFLDAFGPRPQIDSYVLDSPLLEARQAFQVAFLASGRGDQAALVLLQSLPASEEQTALCAST